MSVTFIIGNSGSGKSHYIYNKIINESYEDIRHNYLVIVPEQFTMQTQKTLVSLHKNHCIQNIDVLSFERLAYRVFDELGVSTDNVLEESGKNILIKKIAEERRHSMNVLGRNITKLGYVSEVKSVISELMQYGIKPDEFHKMTEMFSYSLNMKLSDIELIYRGFLEEIEDTYITSEEILDLLISVAEKSAILKGATIVLDGYTGFTPVQKELLSTIIPLADDVYITTTMDTSERYYEWDIHEPTITDVKLIKDHDLFAMSKRMLAEIYNISKGCNASWNDPYVINGENGRLKDNEELSFLESHLFRRDKTVYDKEVKNISITSLKNPKDEIKYVAEEIASLVREQGYRYKDIAIVCGNTDSYKDYVKGVFDKYDIPIFMDEKAELLKHPFVEYVRAFLDVAEKNYSYESVFRFLRSGFSKIENTRIDDLENYIKATGIKGKKAWSNDFIYMPDALKLDLDYINYIREDFMNEVSDAIEVIKKSKVTVKERCDSIKHFFALNEIENELNKRSEFFTNEGDLKRADEYSQIYDVVIGILDKLENLIGDMVIPLKEYKELFEAAVESIKIGIIPPGYDRVVIGNIERTRLNDVKVLFTIGVNDGNIPADGGNGGIISESEREIIKASGIELAPTKKEEVFMQKFYLYMLLSKPSEKLYLTYSRVSSDNSVMRRSYLIGVLLKLFPELKETVTSMDETNLSLLNGEKMLDDLVVNMTADVTEKDKDEQIIGILIYLKEKEPEIYHALIHLLASATEGYKNKVLTPELVRRLYGPVLKGSVTRLEQFAGCEYAHFLRYGLRLKERAEFSFGGIDMGTIVHSALEKYSKKLRENGTSFRNVDDEASDAYLNEAVQDALTESHNFKLVDDERSGYTINRIKRYLNRTVSVIKEQVKSGKFEPTDFEKPFSERQSEHINLNGVIDRIDVAPVDDDIYVNVIDYKTGNTKLDLGELVYGRQLQLATYLSEALKMYSKKNPGKNVRPGGMFYYHVTDDLIDAEYHVADEMLHKSIVAKHKLEGLVTDNPAVYNNMDFKLRESGTSDIVNVTINKDGSMRKTSPVVDEESFNKLLNYTDSIIETLSNKVYSGAIEVNPSQSESDRDNNACRYCAMKSICGFDERVPGYNYRTQEKIDRVSAIETIKNA